MTNSKSSGDNGFESSDGWEVEDEVEIPNGNGEADNNNMEANFEAICDTARYVLSGIMCLMKALKNFEKIAILKIWELVSFWNVKSHFDKLPSEMINFQAWKKIFWPISWVDPIKI